MNVLVIDIGGTNVKILATGQQEPIKFPSGPTMTAKAMVAGVSLVTRDHGGMLGLTPGLPESMLSL
jgi:polyphosphate glucokinase